MKELLSKSFWRDVKHTFDQAREGSAPSSSGSQDNARIPAETADAGSVKAGDVKCRAILFDMDGVLYDADRPIPGAAETISWALTEGVPFLFVTNTTSRSRADLRRKLDSFGIAAVEEQILTPIAAAVEWLRANANGGVAAFVRPAVRSEFAGLNLLPDDAESGAECVVIGDLADLWDFRNLNRAFRLLHNNPGAKLIALGMTRYWMAADGIALDVAPFVVALEHASARKAMVFGKPSAAFFRAAADRLRLSPGEVLMIGDDIEADVAGARAAGLHAALVRTGKFRAADLDLDTRADVVLDSVAGLPLWWAGGR